MSDSTTIDNDRIGEIAKRVRSMQVARIVQCNGVSDTMAIDCSKQNKELVSAIEPFKSTDAPPDDFAHAMDSFFRSRANGARCWHGGYDEDRMWYSVKANDLFDESRSIHMGVDVCHAVFGAKIMAVCEGTVHSLADNDSSGDYGPCVILQHRMDDGFVFHTLYGHLSRASLQSLRVGQAIARGQCIGHMGAPSENGGWGEHVHFQIVVGMQGKRGDFPGVCTPSDRPKFLLNCPDPQLLLRFGEHIDGQ
jgi:peptidoglycan LD-endopeptidase LytH